MHINITSSLTADNKGSSAKLVNYLEKENRINQIEVQEYWFNHKSTNIEPFVSRNLIDKNIAKLSKSDAKFFLINISPSQKEINHLIKTYGNQGAKDKLKYYAGKVMDEYAKNFKRPGINGANDLLWFGKLENHRYYSQKDKEVINGAKRRGDLKEGEQMHIQIIVSRKDATNSIKLSPMNTSRGRNVEHSKKLGQFDRRTFQQSGETVFDHIFDFERKLNETFAYAHIRKNGDINQRVQLGILESENIIKPRQYNLIDHLVKELANFSSNTSSDFLETKGKTLVKELLEDLTGKQEPDITPFNLHRKRKKKTKRGVDQQISF